MPFADMRAGADAKFGSEAPQTASNKVLARAADTAAPRSLGADEAGVLVSGAQAASAAQAVTAHASIPAWRTDPLI